MCGVSLGAERLTDQGDIYGPEAQGGAAELQDQGRDGDLAYQRDTGASEDDEETCGAEGVEVCG